MYLTTSQVLWASLISVILIYVFSDFDIRRKIGKNKK
jgi:hypothetical protein